MDEVRVGRVMKPEEASGLVGTDAPRLAPTVSGGDEGVVARDADDGAPVFAYLPMPRDHVAELREACLATPMSLGVLRSGAGYRTASTTFGSAPRKPIQGGREGCNRTAIFQQHPAVERTLEHLAGYFADTLAAIDPELVRDARATLEAVGEDWRMMREGLWTSGVVNRNSQLPYHRDSLNFPTWSAMPVVRRGVRGGHLHLPEYGTVLPCRDGWAVYWCGNRLVHAVTPLDVRRDGYRYSVVYYALRGMKDCHTYAEETRYARARRTEREESMAERLVTGEKLTGANARLGGGRKNASTVARFRR